LCAFRYSWILAMRSGCVRTRSRSLTYHAGDLMPLEKVIRARQAYVPQVIEHAVTWEDNCPRQVALTRNPRHRKAVTGSRDVVDCRVT